MGLAFYPDFTHLERFFSDAGIDPGGANLMFAVRTGIAAFEQETGRHFLAGKNIDGTTRGTLGVETRLYDPPKHGAPLDLRGELISFSTLTLQGNAKAQGTDFYLLGILGDGGAPWNLIRFSNPFFLPVTIAWTQSVAVSGKWGYSLTVPEDAFQAMLARAALDVFPRAVAAAFGGLASWREADVDESYGNKPHEQTREGWQTLFDSTVRRYRRVAVG